MKIEQLEQMRAAAVAPGANADYDSAHRRAFRTAWNPQAALDVLVAYTELRAVMAKSLDWLEGNDWQNHGIDIAREARRVLAEYPALPAEEPA